MVMVYAYPHGIENKTIEFILLIYILPAITYIAVGIGMGVFALIIILFGALLNLACGRGINPFDEI